MHVARPVFPECFFIVHIADRCQIVRKRVKPHIDNVLRIKRHGNPPVERRARDAQILESLLDEADHLVAPRDGLDKIGVLLDIRKHTIRVLAHAEEVRLLGDFLHGAVAVGAVAVLVELQLRPVALAWRAVEPLVLPLVNISLIVYLLENILHKLMMALLRRADEIVVRDAEQLPQFLKACDDAVDIRLRRDALLLRRLLNLLPVLIRAGQEEHIIAREPLEPRDRIRDGRAVRVTDVELCARVVNGGGDIKRRLFTHYNSSFRSVFFIIVPQQTLSRK